MHTQSIAVSASVRAAVYEAANHVVDLAGLQSYDSRPDPPNPNPKPETAEPWSLKLYIIPKPYIMSQSGAQLAVSP